MSPSMKKYMVVETFKPGCKPAVYTRYAARGRMLPEGLTYLTSWVTDDDQRCFQLMEAVEPELFDEWISRWSDLVEFEIFPVQGSPTQGDG